MVFTVSLIPVIGGIGVAIDHARAVRARAVLQSLADQTALMMVVAKHAGQTPDLQATLGDLFGRAAMGSELKAGGALSGASGSWTGTYEYKLTVPATLKTSLAAIFQPSLSVAVVAQASGMQEVTQSNITGSNLDPEAGDYNELQAYCYNAKTQARLGPIDGDTGARGPFAKIADNTDAGVKAGPANLNVRCGTDEQVSYLLKNIRDARANVTLQRTGTPRYFYTDATKSTSGDSAGALSYAVTLDGVARNTLETILCDTEADCKPKSQGGKLPNNHQTGRSPQVNTKVCAPGKYLYFGWEDRIPGYVKNGVSDDSDRDYDDIRLVVTCPTTTLGPFRVRLSA